MVGTVSLRQLPVGNIRFNEPQKKKTGFDVLKSSPKNGEQVRMPGGRETRTGKNKNKKKPPTQVV